jgi:hypothetical protein
VSSRCTAVSVAKRVVFGEVEVVVDVAAVSS